MINAKKIFVVSSILFLSSQPSYSFMDNGSGFMENMSSGFLNDISTDFNIDTTKFDTNEYSDLENTLVGISGDYEESKDGVIVVKEGGSIQLGVNAQAEKIVLNNAKSISLSVNSSVKVLEGTVETADFGVNSQVEQLYLKVDNLKISVNAELKAGNIYVYKNFEGGVNAEFKGKMTVYGETSLSVNSGIEGRYCSLGKVGLEVNSNINTYSMNGLLGNIDPILDVTIIDSAEKFKTVQTLTESFDKLFDIAITKIDTYNNEILSLKSQISKEKDETKKTSLETDLSIKTSAKKILKDETIVSINQTFVSLVEYIDDDERNTKLFEKIKDIYVFAIEQENVSQVYNICNNAEVVGNVNSTYEKNGKLYINGKSFARKVFLSNKEVESLDKMMNKIPDEKLAKVNAKIDDMQEIIASKKKITKSDEKNLNMLMDVKELLRSEMIYE